MLLIFEHRNYFPSVGLLLAVAGLASTGVPDQHMRSIAVGVVCLFAFYAGTTFLRSMEWSSPLALAASDAAKRPNSPAAQYEYARILLTSSQSNDPATVRETALSILEKLAKNPLADAASNQLLIVHANSLKQPVSPVWWDDMISKLSGRPPTSTEVTALAALVNCYDASFCTRDIDHLHRALAAATGHRRGYAMLNAAYGHFAANYLGDNVLADAQFRKAISRSGGNSKYKLQLAAFLIDTRQLTSAEAAIADLRANNPLGMLNIQIAEFEHNLAAAKNKAATR